MDAVSRGSGRRKVHDVVWFETLEEGTDPTTGDSRLIRAVPYIYLVSFLAFPLLCTLAVIGPWGTPVWPWGLGIAACEVVLRDLVSSECKKQGRSPNGFYALRTWVWMRFGGGVRQALRAIVTNRRVQSRPGDSASRVASTQ